MREREPFDYTPPNRAVELFIGCAHPIRLEEEEHDLDLAVRSIDVDSALQLAFNSLRDEDGGDAGWKALL